MTDKEKIQKSLKSYYANENIKLPGKFQFIEDGNCITIVLCSDKIKKDNMQVDENAFEAWASAIHLATGKTIIMDTDQPFDYDKYEGQGHLCRFLYRALRFQEQYKWFGLSDYLQGEISGFDVYINDESNTLVNNYPNEDATENDKDESRAEHKLARKGIPELSGNRVFQQLPVGLFKGEASAANMIFTRGHAAIDLWTWKDSEFIVIELKANNKMAGIVTEIFFYSNYMRDLLCRNVFTLEKNPKILKRGYENIIGGKFDKITGVMLANIYHPIINRDLIEALNDNNCEIQYICKTYDFDELMK